MGAQACANLDKKLTEIYSEKVTVNLDQKSTISPEDFWKSMQVIAVNNRAILNIAK
jgi:hypothetical protein